MTVSTTTNSQSYAGSGTSPFNFPYKFFEDTDLVVTRRTGAGVLTTLVLNTDYTVTGAGSEGGGTVTPTASETGNTITVTRQLPRTQETDYSDLGPFPAEATETALDRLIMLMQETYERSGNALRIPTGGVNYDAGGLKIENLANGTNLNDAANVATVQSLITGSGNVPAPLAAQVGGLYAALSTGTAGWLIGSTSVASAATVDLQAITTPVVLITGTSTITSLGTPTTSGQFKFIRFTGSLTLTNSAALVLEGGANIQTNAGDTMIVVSSAGIGWRSYGYMKADGSPVTLADGSVPQPKIDPVYRRALNLVQDFRLTLTSGLPVTTSDVTGATTIYCTPYVGNSIALYDGTNWNIRTSAEFSLSLGTLTSGRPYDVFCYDNAGVPTLEFTAWTNDTTRATALVYQDGVLVRSGAVTRRYLGTFYTTSTTQTADSVANRFLWNYYNRVSRSLFVTDATATWNYTTATIRQANGAAANQVNFVVGVAEDLVDASLQVTFANTSANVVGIAGFGLDSTAALAADQLRAAHRTQVANTPVSGVARYLGNPGIGRHFLAWLEFSAATGTMTWTGSNDGPSQTGIRGTIRG